MIQVQSVRFPGADRVTWTVIGDNYLPIEPIGRYLRYLESVERSPHTLRSYAKNLKLYWEYLSHYNLEWKTVSLENVAEFIHWLRNPLPGIASMQVAQAKRTEKTINHILNTVCMFYDFHQRLGEAEAPDMYRFQVQRGRAYKSFLHHINKSKAVRTRLLKLKEPKQFPGCLSVDEVRTLINACNRIRDKFLLCLLYETGMRIGEVLGLRHEDLVTEGQNEIRVKFRFDNTNNARAKSRDERIIHVSKDLMALYSDYLINEYPENIDSDYVFVSIWGREAEPGTPMTYRAVDSLFKRLHKKTGIKANPHLFRHTHATELIRSGWDLSYVQKRLGHSDIQTTINTYVHLMNEDLKEAYKEYLVKRESQLNAES